MPQEPRFQHHGERAETREQWAARQRAAHARTQGPAPTPASAPSRPSPPESPRSNPASLPPRRRLRGLGAALLLAGGVATLAAFGSSSSSSPAPQAADRTARESPHRASGLDLPAPPVKVPPPAEEPDIWGGLTARRAWADAPPIAPQPDGWWCLCYKTQTGADHTACRRLAGECTELLTRVQTQGSASIQRGSATPSACQHVRGNFPWLRLGHRGAWTASEYPGATQASSVCALATPNPSARD